MPGHPHASHNLGEIAMQLGKAEAALPYYAAALAADPSQSQFWLSYANALVGLGRLDGAAELLAEGRRRGLAGPAAEPLTARIAAGRQADADFATGVALHQAGRFAQAVEQYQTALTRRPDHADATSNLAIALHSLGRNAEAEATCRRAIAIKPEHVGAHLNLGNILLGLDRPADAAASFRRAISIDPVNLGGHVNLGNVLYSQGQLDGAEACYRRAIEIDPRCAEAHCNLGLVMGDCGRLQEAEESLKRSLAIRPDYPDALSNLAIALQHLGRFGEAADACARALAIAPDHAGAWLNLGNAKRALGNAREAEASYRKAVGVRSNYAQAHGNLGLVLGELGRLDESESRIRQSLSIDPNRSAGWFMLGNVVRALGRHDEARAHLERGLSLDPGSVEGYKSLLGTYAYDPATTPDGLFAVHRRFEAALAAPLYVRARAHANAADPQRRLRIGYLSSDFRSHSAAQNLLPLFKAHDRAAIEVCLYAEVANPDPVTDAFRSAADSWRSTVGHSDSAVADMVRGDGIDILVCLAGRFDQNRPLVCAYRPAPIQISSHDVATSGLAAVDYLFSDRVLTPRNGQERFAERLLCLPSFVLAGIPDGVPKSLPRGGPVVFGCFNSPAKVSDAVLDLWAQLLGRVPGSRLLLRYMNWYEAESIRARVHAALDKHGIDRSRVSFPPAAPSYLRHLEIYNEIDIALDTFPFSGSTTTLDSLLMGVPVVTLPGWSMVSRWSASMLASLKLDEFVAGSAEEYLGIAQRLSQDRPKLSALRRELGDRLAHSPLCDAPRKARQVERFYRAVWRRWSRLPDLNRHDR